MSTPRTSLKLQAAPAEKGRQGGGDSLAAMQVGSRADLAYATIRESIESKDLRPGDRLREVDLAAHIGVSRTPIREALKRLETDGLVESVDGGFRVRTFTLTQIVQLYAMREVLVGAAGRFAATHASSSEIESMRAILERLRTSTTPEQAGAENARLHQLIVVAAHNSYLMATTAVLNNGCALLSPSSYEARGRLKEGYKENLLIVNAIANHEPNEAEEACRRHMRSRLKVLLSLIDETTLAG